MPKTLGLRRTGGAMRWIAVRHRVKKTAAGEARPTQVVIKKGDEVETISLETEQDELDFLLGRWPKSWRLVAEGEDISSLPKHHQVQKKEDGPVRVPDTYDGLLPGDVVLSILGGSGDRLCSAMSRRGEEIGARVLRIPAHNLKQRRSEDQDKEDDAETLLRVFKAEPDAFSLMVPADRDIIAVRETYFSRQETQRARIGCENRLRQRFIGKIFLSEEGRYPEGSIEDQWDEVKANDAILQALVKEEARAETALRKAVHKIPVWREVLSEVTGIGEVLAAGLISPIGDIRRFSTEWKFNKFCGTHVMTDGRFPRRRAGEYGGYSPKVRQALYLFADQANRRKDSVWGARLLEIKAEYRVKHPEPIVGEGGKKKYTDGHILKMARWRMCTEFVLWLYGEWTRVATTKDQSSEAA